MLLTQVQALAKYGLQQSVYKWFHKTPFSNGILNILHTACTLHGTFIIMLWNIAAFHHRVMATYIFVIWQLMWLWSYGSLGIRSYVVVMISNILIISFKIYIAVIVQEWQNIVRSWYVTLYGNNHLVCFCTDVKS